uniref:Uncharacterized protein n=1 Tax=Papio anubis TaxID=9555 RepID=A0A8I5R155_PAPAN
MQKTSGGGRALNPNWFQCLYSTCQREALTFCSPSKKQLGTRYFSPQARHRFHAALASCSTSMLILSNLVFLGGNEVGKTYWNRIFIQGKLLDSAVFSQFLVFHVCG